MRNIFLVYMPLGNAEAMVHYEDTIKTRVPLDRVAKYLSTDSRSRLDKVFASRPTAVWGSSGGKANQGKFDKMREGDELLIVEGDRIRLIGYIALKVENADLSRELWKPFKIGAGKTWELVYFIANPRELDVAFVEFNRLFGYEDKYHLYGFSSVSQERLETFYSKYDDLYSVLVKIQAGEVVATKPPLVVEHVAPTAEETLVPLATEDVEEILSGTIGTDHSRMQLKLALLGLKAGERIWIPAGDQTRLQRLYDFDKCDREFTAAMDVHPSVKNIDVVWRQEFRIDAAYEVENSTAIYSGLLRFADLAILAPNSIYPMYIVSQSAKKGLVREQVRRPTFAQLKLADKVKFLSYEAIDEIGRVFETTSKGLSVDFIDGRSEHLT
jgi:hypothetical protein